MRRTKEQKAITLIALIITIVVLLILAEVAISSITNDGILSYAQNAAKDYNKAVLNEKYYLSQLEEFLTENQTGVKVEKVTDVNPGKLEGSGTEADPYVINSIEDLVFFSYDVRQGNTYIGKYVNLGLDLDFNSTKSYVEAYRTDYGKYGYNGELKTLLTSGEGFLPIGTTSNIDMALYSFAGTFDGQGNEIINLYINKITVPEEEMRIGLFGGNYGIIKNLGIINGNVSLTMTGTTCDLGGIVGKHYNTIENCYYIGNNNIYAQNTVTGLIRMGGISSGIGNASTVIKNSYHIGKIYLKNESAARGIQMGGIASSVGDNTSIEGCFSKGAILVESANNAQLGYLYVGGITSMIDNQIALANCYNEKEITLSVDGTVKNGVYIGGILGNGNNSSESADGIVNCYNIGKIDTNISNYEGSIIGSGLCPISNCFYLTGSYLQGADLGTTYASSIIEKTEAEMKQEEFVTLLNGGTGTAWKKDTNNINTGYPILSWQ